MFLRLKVYLSRELNQLSVESVWPPLPRNFTEIDQSVLLKLRVQTTGQVIGCNLQIYGSSVLVAVMIVTC